MKITKKHTTTIWNICHKISNKSGVPVDDLYAECLNKLPRVIDSFDPRIGKPFEALLYTSMRGYALNYCRDKSFLSSIKRNQLLLYQKSKKFRTLRQASEALMVPIETLRDLHYQISIMRKYNSINLDEEWKLPVKRDTGSNALLILNDLIDEAEEKLLEDYYINEEDSEYMIDVYGPDYETRVNTLVDRIKNHEDEFKEYLQY